MKLTKSQLNVLAREVYQRLKDSDAFKNKAEERMKKINADLEIYKKSKIYKEVEKILKMEEIAYVNVLKIPILRLLKYNIANCPSYQTVTLYPKDHLGTIKDMLERELPIRATRIEDIEAKILLSTIVPDKEESVDDIINKIIEQFK